MTGQDQAPPVPMPLIIANELEILGSHGMQAHRYPEMFDLIETAGIDLPPNDLRHYFPGRDPK